MAYCVEADLALAAGGADRLVELADQDNNNAADPTVIARAIERADSLIDSYASKLFAVPFNPVPSEVKTRSAELAVLFLKRMGPRSWTQDDRDDYKDHVEWLKALANGDVTPGTDPVPAKATMVRDRATARPDSKDVGRNQTKGYW